MKLKVVVNNKLSTNFLPLKKWKLHKIHLDEN